MAPVLSMWLLSCFVFLFVDADKCDATTCDTTASSTSSWTSSSSWRRRLETCDISCIEHVEEGCKVFIDMEIDLMLLAFQAYNKSSDEGGFMSIFEPNMMKYYNDTYNNCSFDRDHAQSIQYNLMTVILIHIAALLWTNAK